MSNINQNNGSQDSTKSIIGSLLEEISWEGSKVNKYRDGGKGLENVLTAEVLQILYFLPRKHFLGEIINKLYSKNFEAIEKLLNEIEDSEFRLFPDNYYLRKHPTSHQKGIPVQPDSILITDSVYALMEFKIIKTSSFQKLQLPREFYLVTREVRNRIPLLILILSKTPPVSVKGNGKVEPGEYIKRTLPMVFEEADSHWCILDETLALVDESIAWITWDTIKVTIVRQKETYTSKNLSEKMSINRLCDALLDAIDRHS